MLVVQRTGWGKSMVYFLATKLLREQGMGPTLLISPLLSLMRNQLEAAQRIGVRASTINSTNREEWQKVQDELGSNLVDILLISPERLANQDFLQNVLSSLGNLGLFVVDEAHCISDWGHDFRPDYRRIVRILQALPSNIPVLATTATANDRVVEDVRSQLGRDIVLQRGSLVRKSLKLQNINMPSQAARMAWLAQSLPLLPGSGIIYTLTQRDAERVAEWLQINAIKAEAYHASIPNLEDGSSLKEALEQKLLNNEIKVLVATVALGMGFDKPDLGFVIHFQRPASVVHYYQQVGRAGRAVDNAFGILLRGEEDDHIADYFIGSAFPPQQHISEVLEALDRSHDGLSIPAMQSVLNLRKSQLEKTLKFLTVESPSPVTKIGARWQVTAAASSYRVDVAYVDAIIEIRRREQRQMQQYMEHTGCLMGFLQTALDDPNPQPCGKCRNCRPDLLLGETFSGDLENRARQYLRSSYVEIPPRKQWPANDPLPIYQFKGRIGVELQASEGRALSLLGDAGWGQWVSRCKFEKGAYDQQLVAACVAMIKNWQPMPVPAWLTCIPSPSQPDLTTEFAKRLAGKLGLPFFACFQRSPAKQSQEKMVNSFQQAKNLDGVFKLRLKPGSYGPCFLVDDMVESRWTVTVAAALLRRVGCEAVFPLALALNTSGMNG